MTAGGAKPIKRAALATLTLVRRELLRVARERSRWLGAAVQPALLWAILGLGMEQGLAFRGAESLGYRAYFLPGVCVLSILFSAVFSTISLIEDRQRGVLRQALLSPAPRSAVAIGVVASSSLLSFAQGFLVCLLLPAADLHWGDVHLLGLALALLASAVLFSAIGVALAWLSDSTHAFHAVLSVVLIPLWTLSGAVFPPPGGAMGALVAINPLTYCVSATRHALGGWQSGPSALMSGAALGLCAAAMAIAACWLVSRRSERWM